MGWWSKGQVARDKEMEGFPVGSLPTKVGKKEESYANLREIATVAWRNRRGHFDPEVFPLDRFLAQVPDRPMRDSSDIDLIEKLIADGELASEPWQRNMVW